MAALVICWHRDDPSRTGTRLVLGDEQLKFEEMPFVVKPLDRGWEIERTEPGLLVNDQPAFRQALAHGDCIAALGEPITLFFEDAPWEPPLPAGAAAFQAAIEAEPNEEGPRRVLTDFLIEHGHPLGNRMAVGAPRSPTDAARLLPGLGWALARAYVEVDWHTGYVDRLTLDGEHLKTAWVWTLRRALELEPLRYVRRITVAGRTRFAPLPETDLKAIFSFCRPLPCLELVELPGRKRTLKQLLGEKLWASEQSKFPRAHSR